MIARHLLVTLLLFVLALPCLAQKPAKRAINIDSLTLVIENNPDDTLKVRAFNDLTWELKNRGKYDLSVHYGWRGIALCKKLNDSVGLAAMYGNVGVSYFRKGDYDSSEIYHNKAISLREILKDTSGIGMGYNNLGLINIDRGNYSLALDYLLQSLAIKEKVGDEGGAIAAMGNIGIVYNALELPDTSLKYFERALALAIKIDDKRAIAFSNNNIGVIWHKKKQYDKALLFFREALSIKMEIKEGRGIAGSRTNIASVYSEQGLYKEAIIEFDSALTFYRKMGDGEGISSTLNLKGNTLLKMKLLDDAKACFSEAHEMATADGNLPEVQNAAEGLAMVYDEKGDFASAYKYFKQYSELKDSLTSQETTRKAVTTQLSYDYQKKEAVKQAEEAAKELLRQEEARQQKLYLLFISGIAVLVLLLALFIYKGYRQKQKANLDLDDKNRKIENAYRIIEHKNKEITDSINYARRIQAAVLPETETVERYIPTSFILYKPKDIVGGDFYYLEKGVDGNVFLAVADCTGHGVPGAFMSLICSRELKLANMLSGSPGKILHLVNKGVKETLRQNNMDGTRDGMDIALVRLAPNKITYSGANRPLWVLRNSSGTIEEYKPTKSAIGGHTPNEQLFDEVSVDVSSGDIVYLFSDGYADQFGGDKGKKLTTKKFREILYQIATKPMPEQRQHLLDFIAEWQGNTEQIDDLLVIGLKIS